MPEPEPDLAPAFTAQDAIADLPKIFALQDLENGKLKRGTRRLKEAAPHANEEDASAYARTMRSWSGFESRSVLQDHAIRYLPRDYKLFARLSPGDQYPEAYRKAEEMFQEELRRRQVDRTVPKEGSESWQTVRALFVPPYDHTKFPNKWRKMEPDKPARTLLAHLGKDSYSHIHYDNAQASTISVREAARLQSFPDGFKFSGTMNPAFKQIGNAVPPLLAKAIGDELLTQIKASLRI